MGKIKEHTNFSKKFLEEEKEADAALKEVSKELIEETKKIATLLLQIKMAS